MTTVRYRYERNYCGVCNISQHVFIATCQTKGHIIIMEVLVPIKWRGQGHYGDIYNDAGLIVAQNKAKCRICFCCCCPCSR